MNWNTILININNMINHRWRRKHGKEIFQTENNSIPRGTSLGTKICLAKPKVIGSMINEFLDDSRWSFNVITHQSTTLLLCVCGIPSWWSFIEVQAMTTIVPNLTAQLLGLCFRSSRYLSAMRARRISFIDSVVKVRNSTSSMWRVKFIRCHSHQLCRVPSFNSSSQRFVP